MIIRKSLDEIEAMARAGRVVAEVLALVGEHAQPGVTTKELDDVAEEFIRSRGGNPGRVDRWGKRRFAYELHHRWEGYYVVVSATAEPPVMEELHRMLSLADEVIRHKVIRLPDAALGGTAAAAAATEA